MIADTTLVGLVLLTAVPILVVDATSSLRAGFDGRFWEKPLELKLPTIRARVAAWNRLGIAWIWMVIVLGAGLAGFTFHLAGAGEATWAGLGLGAYLVSAVVFVPGALLMSTTIAAAADEQDRTGAVPAWAAPVWQAAWWAERGFVIGANLAYVAWGIGILRSGFPADWVGWVAIGSGAFIALWASLREYFYQHMTLLTPIALGVALLLA